MIRSEAQGCECDGADAAVGPGPTQQRSTKHCRARLDWLGGHGGEEGAYSARPVLPTAPPRDHVASPIAPRPPGLAMSSSGAWSAGMKSTQRWPATTMVPMALRVDIAGTAAKARGRLVLAVC